MVVRVASFLVVLALCGPSSAAMYKCVEGGKTKFQDKPCANSAADENQINVRTSPTNVPSSVPPPAEPSLPGEAAPVAAPAPPSVSQKRSKPECPHITDNELRKAYIAHRVIRCMTMAQVKNAAGVKSDFQVSNGADDRGPWEQWFFSMSYEGFPSLVEFRDGKVAKFGNTDELGLPMHGGSQRTR